MKSIASMLFVLAAALFFSGPAQAGYADGMNQYAGYHVMHGKVDPTGLASVNISPKTASMPWFEKKLSYDDKKGSPFGAVMMCYQLRPSCEPCVPKKGDEEKPKRYKAASVDLEVRLFVILNKGRIGNNEVDANGKIITRDSIYGHEQRHLDVLRGGISGDNQLLQAVKDFEADLVANSNPISSKRHCEKGQADSDVETELERVFLANIHHDTTHGAPQDQTGYPPIGTRPKKAERKVTSQLDGDGIWRCIQPPALKGKDGFVKPGDIVLGRN